MRIQKYLSEVPHGIMFHHFHDARHPRGQGSVSQEDFDAILRCVGLDHILSPEEWLERLAQRRLTNGQVCLTFDDALRCQFDLALPVLAQHKLTAFWFVYSSVFEGQMEKLELYRVFRSTRFQQIDEFYEQFFRRVFASAFSQRAHAVLTEDDEIRRRLEWFPFYSVNDVKFRLVRDRVLGKRAYEQIMDEMVLEAGLSLEGLSKGVWMSNDDLRHLSRQGHAVGLHSYSHPTALAELSLAAQREEYERNAAHLRQTCGVAPLAMAHPCNSYTGRTLAILKQLRIRCGFRSNMAPPQDGGAMNPTPWELARQDHANVMRRLGRSLS